MWRTVFLSNLLNTINLDLFRHKGFYLKFVKSACKIVFNYLFYLNFTYLHPLQTLYLHGFDEGYKYIPKLVLYLEKLGLSEEKNRQICHFSLFEKQVGIERRRHVFLDPIRRTTLIELDQKLLGGRLRTYR